MPWRCSRHVEWLALGFEIIDCPYADWKFQPADFVAAYGLHAALVVGEPSPVAADTLAALVEQLAAFTVALSKDDAVVAEGGGKNSLRSPALCLAELASARDASGAAGRWPPAIWSAPARSPSRSRSRSASAGARTPSAWTWPTSW